MTSFGFLWEAPMIAPRPMGPQPATTTTSSKVSWARSTACSEQDSGSEKAAWCGGISEETLWARARAGTTMYSAIAPS